MLILQNTKDFGKIKHGTYTNYITSYSYFIMKTLVSPTCRDKHLSTKGRWSQIWEDG